MLSKIDDIFGVVSLGKITKTTEETVGEAQKNTKCDFLAKKKWDEIDSSLSGLLSDAIFKKTAENR